MSTRTVDELRTIIKNAFSANDTAGIEQCLRELDLLGTWEARAAAADARGLVDCHHGNFTSSLEQYQHALAIYEEAGYEKGIATITNSIGCIYGAMSNHPAALDHFQRAATLHEELGDRSGVLNDRLGMAGVYSQIGDHAAALEFLNDSAAYYEESGNIGELATTLGKIGLVHSYIGDYTSALEFLHRSLALNEEHGNKRAQCSTLNSIGVVYGSTGNFPAALEHFHRFLVLVNEFGDLNGIAMATSNLGNVERSIGNYPAALEQYHQALVRYEQTGDRSGVARSLMNIGLVHEDTGDYPAALEFLQRSFQLHEELGNRSGAAIATGNIGSVYHRSGKFSEALEHYMRASEELAELGEQVQETFDRTMVLKTLLDMGRVDEARTTLITIDAKPLDVPIVQIQVESQRARLHVVDGDVGSAGRALQLAREVAQQSGLRAELADVHKQLRDLCQTTNDFAGYIEHNNEFTRITEEINGKDTAKKLAMRAKQREIDAREKEHAKHMAVLHSTLPKHIADRVARGEVVNDSFDNAAVLFLDVVGFTTNSSELDASVVVQLLQDIFTTFDGICATHDVMKIKTIGDSYMAVAFGTENTEQRTANSEQRIANVALEMMASEFTWPHTSERVVFRIGLHCGPVVAGVLGTERMQYDVWGDTVNVASRMESSSEPGRIHISEAFATLLPATSSGDSTERPLQVLERGTMEIKGKGKMKTYWLDVNSE